MSDESKILTPPPPDHTIARRIRFMRITGQWLVDLCKGQETRRCKPVAHVLPSDAIFLDAKVSENGHPFLVIESRSFKIVAPNEMIPEHPPVEFQIVTYAHDLRGVRAGPSVDDHAFASTLEEFEAQLDAYAVDDNVPNDVVRALRVFHERLSKLRVQ